MKKLLSILLVCCLLLSCLSLATADALSAEEAEEKAKSLVGLKIPADFFTESCNGGEVISAELVTNEDMGGCQYVNALVISTPSTLTHPTSSGVSYFLWTGMVVVYRSAAVLITVLFPMWKETGPSVLIRQCLMAMSYMVMTAVISLQAIWTPHLLPMRNLWRITPACI